MVPIIVGAALFQAAYSNATQFDNDARLRDWRHVLFYPAFSSQVQPGLRRCFSDADAKSGKTYKLVLKFDAAGPPTQVVIESNDPALKCFAKAVSAANFPMAPVPNFAEHFDLTVGS
jgi:hypothetical protein